MLRAHSEKTCAKIQNYQDQFWKTSEEMKNLVNHYNANLFEPLARRLPQYFGQIPHAEWKDQLKVVDEIVCARFDQRKLPFNLTEHEMHTMMQFMRDDFYVRKFGSKEAALLGSSDLRRFLANSFSDRIQQLNDKRLIILSAHDTTITMMLSAMGLA